MTDLSDRQTQMLQGLADGRSVDEIAGALYISRDTAKKHVQIAYRKLGATNAAGAVARAFREGLIT